MKSTLKAALAAVAVLSIGSAARADLTHQGAVGLPLNPTAQIPGPNSIRVQADYWDLGDVETVDFGLKYFGLHAAGRVGGQLEINGGVNAVRGDNVLEALDRTGINIGAKYLFTRETDPAGVRIAAGAGYSRAFANNWHAYVVGTKSFGRGISEGNPSITGHLGLRYDHYDLDFLVNGLDSGQASVYGGIEIPFARSFAFVGELQSKDMDYDDLGVGEAKMPYSASIRFRPSGKGFSASVGFQRRNYPIFSHDNGFFAQIGYTFGEGEDAGVSAAESNETP